MIFTAPLAFNRVHQELWASNDDNDDDKDDADDGDG